MGNSNYPRSQLSKMVPWSIVPFWVLSILADQVPGYVIRKQTKLQSNWLLAHLQDCGTIWIFQYAPIATPWMPTRTAGTIRVLVSASLKLFRWRNSILRKEDSRKNTHGCISLKRSTVMPQIALSENLLKSKNLATSSSIKETKFDFKLHLNWVTVQPVTCSLSVEKRGNQLAYPRFMSTDI